MSQAVREGAAILGAMALDISAVQAALREDALDGWLLYDFHGSNPIARAVVAMETTAKLTTRRWYYLIPANGKPRALVHAIERESLAHLPGSRHVYAGRQQLQDGLAALVGGCERVAMEYSPDCAIPYVSRVDAGTLDAIRGLGVDVVSSGDLVQHFEAMWDAEALRTHREASERLYRDQGPRVCPGGRARGDGYGSDRVRDPAGDGSLVRGGGARHRFTTGGGSAGEQREPPLFAD